MRAPEISIITSYFNAAENPEFLEEAYNSILSQDVDWEWIIQCDRPMVDRDRQLIRKDPRVKVFNNPKRLGTAVSKNRALTHSRGEHIFALDDDDYIAPNALKKLLAALERDPESFASFGHCATVSLDGAIENFRVWPPESRKVMPGEVDGAFFQGYFLLTAATLLWRRKHLVSLGGWMALHNSEDTGVVVTAAARWPMIALAEIVYYYRETEASNTSSPEFKTERKDRFSFIQDRITYSKELEDE